MSYNEKNDLIFPTRTGDSIGTSAERIMLDKVGASGIATRIQENLDGSTTRLKTRGGFPEFVTTPAGKTAFTNKTFTRNFAAAFKGAARGLAYSPYTLATVTNYEFVGHTYEVTPITSTFNVPLGDTTHWHDVLSYRKGRVYVNGKLYPDLAIPESSRAGMPHLIPADGTGLAAYGSAAVNASTKRVFLVAGDSVYSFNNGGVTYTLPGSSQRTAKKALVCGPKVTSDHKARLTQVAFTGGTWDALSGAWQMTSAEVAMLLTPPYLTATSGSVVLDTFVSAPSSTPVTTSSSGDESYLMPEADITLVGTYVAGTTLTNSLARAYAPYTEAYRASRNGYKHLSYTQNEYKTLFNDSLALGNGLTATMDALTRTRYKSSSEYYRTLPSDSTPLPGTGFAPDCSYNGPGNAWYSGPTPNGIYGFSAIPNPSWTSPSVSYTDTSWEMSMSTDLGGTIGKVVDIAATRTLSTGQRLQITGCSGAFSAYYGDFHLTLGGNVDNYNTVAFNCVNYNDPSDWDAVVAGRAAFLGSKFYPALDNASYADFGGTGWPYSTSTQSYTTEVGRLSWKTKDFLYHNDNEQIYIYVEGDFIGTQNYQSGNGVATLTVTLVISTPKGTVRKVLRTQRYDCMDLVPLLPLIDGQPSPEYIPVPVVRPFFTPLFREQGMFPGIAHTSTLESSAVVAMDINFPLRLCMYGNFGTVNEDNADSATVSFVPANLLEMLYACVFSQKYGVDTTERYPVDFPNRFKDLQRTLFSDTIHVAYRDGSLSNWTQAFGGAYATSTTTQLFRS